MGANAADDPLLRYLITGIAGRSARAAIGHPAAAPPSSVMNSRRLMPNMGGSNTRAPRLRPNFAHIWQSVPG